MFPKYSFCPKCNKTVIFDWTETHCSICKTRYVESCLNGPPENIPLSNIEKGEKLNPYDFKIE